MISFFLLLILCFVYSHLSIQIESNELTTSFTIENDLLEKLLIYNIMYTETDTVMEMVTDKFFDDILEEIHESEFFIQHPKLFYVIFSELPPPPKKNYIQ